VIAWKLLQPGSVGLFSGFAWPTPTASAAGSWVEVELPLRPSIHGVHAVRTASLMDWLDDELWEIELDGEIVETDALLVASRGRLRRRVAEWDGDAAEAFSASCVLAVRDAVAAEIDESGAAEVAAMLAGLSDAHSLFEFASQLAPGDEARVSGLIYLADCVLLAAGGRPTGYEDHPGRDLPTTPAAIAANVGFVAAAGIATIATRTDARPEAFGRGFAGERARQLTWLVDRLGLVEPA
jgi:hypothetical protein